MPEWTDRGVFVTREMEDTLAFQTGIFVTRASTLVPFVVKAESADFQVSNQINEEYGKATSKWCTCAVPAGIGQYSLMHEPAGLVTRVEAYFRPVTQAEAQEDFERYGEQVTAECIDDIPESERAGKMFIPFLGTKFLYTGPPERLLKLVFVTRFFPGEVPEDIASLVKEVDGAVPEADSHCMQRYDLFHAKDGKVVCSAPFKKPEEFSLESLKHFTDVEIKGNTRLWAYPHGDRNKAIDISGYRRQH